MMKHLACDDYIGHFLRNMITSHNYIHLEADLLNTTSPTNTTPYAHVDTIYLDVIHTWFGYNCGSYLYHSLYEDQV